MNAVTQTPRSSLVTKMGHKYGVDPEKMLSTLIGTVFRQKDGQQVSNEQMLALLVVADHHDLNPFTREIFAFPDKDKGIIPIISLDGWLKLINGHPQFNGMDDEWSDQIVTMPGAKPCPAWCRITMHRKDRDKPTKHREWLDEVYRAPFKGKSKFKEGEMYEIAGPWQTHTKRMLEWKAIIQTSRVAFGFAGIYDQDEAERIVAGDTVLVNIPPQASRTDQAKALLGKTPEHIDNETGEITPELPIADENATPPWPTE